MLTGAALVDGWSALVERDGERELIDEALSSSELSRGRFVILYGPAGVGRSSVIAASALAADERGMAVIQACGSELERGYGFGVVRQLLESRIAGLTCAQRRSLLGEAGPGVASALGITGTDHRESSSAFEQIEGLHRLISRLAATKPLLIAVDDLQWCDRPSLDFLCFLGHRANRLPVTIIAAWRRGEPGVRAGRLQALAGKPDTLFLTLAPLSYGGILALVKRVFATEPDDEAVRVIQARTAGQPRLVAELVAGLRLRSIPPKASAHAAIARLTPEPVRREIVARLGRHPETVQRLAEAVAVLEEGTVAQVAALADIDLDRARAAAAALVRAGILRDDAIVAYAQPLLRAAAYGTLSSLECAELHRRAAATLCAGADGPAPVDTGRVAEHLLRSDPAGDPCFAQVLLETARRASGTGAFAEARRYLQRALGEIEDSSSRGAVLVQLAELELQSGDLASAAMHASEGLGLASTSSERVAASLISAQIRAASGDWAEAVDVIESQSARIHERGPKLAMEAAAATLRVCGNAPASGSPDEIAGWESLAGTSAAERAMLAACASHMTQIGAGDAVRVRDLCARAVGGRVEKLGAGVTSLAEYLARRTAILADAGTLIEPVLGRERDPDSATPGDDRELARSALRSSLLLARGDLSEAQTETSVALDLLKELPSTSFRRLIRADLLAALIAIRIEQARHDEAAETLAHLSGAATASRTVVISLRIALALGRSAPAEAAACATQLDREPPGIAAPGISWPPWAARAHHAAGDHDLALALADAHLEFARSWGAPRPLGNALLVRAEVDPGKQRLRLLEEAVSVLEPTSSRLELARAHIELGVALRRARRRRDARAQLMHGADLAHHCGATTLSGQARAELVAVGARPRRDAFTGPRSLTVSELRVARLAATGMTNREIARELVVSAKTVSGQLTAVYRKLDVHDRGALAAAIQNDQASSEPSVAAVG